MLRLRFPNFRDNQCPWLSIMLVNVLPQSYVDIPCVVEFNVVRGVLVKATRYASLQLAFQQREKFERKAKKPFGYIEDGCVGGSRKARERQEYVIVR